MAVEFFRKILRCRDFCAVIFIAGAGFFNGSALASQDVPDVLSFAIFDEFRFGVLSNDASKEKDGVNLNAEVLFQRPNIYYDNKLLLFLFNPRLHVGGSLNTDGGVSKAYVGATWDYRLTNRLFVEASFGGAIHDGKLKKPPGSSFPALGCRVIFRESASVGFEFTERLSMMVTVDHISNADLCNFNDGLTTLGARLGYKF